MTSAEGSSRAEAAADFSRYHGGELLYDDDFSLEEIETWFAEEEDGYYQLILEEGGDDYLYCYRALNDHHGFRFLAGRRFAHCLAIGCSNGDDIAPLAAQVDRFHAIEPARKWWSDAIAGTPANFVAPQAWGRIDMPEDEFDLCVVLGVLHHVPNVSAVLGEARGS